MHAFGGEFAPNHGMFDIWLANAKPDGRGMTMKKLTVVQAAAMLLGTFILLCSTAGLEAVSEAASEAASGSAGVGKPADERLLAVTVDDLPAVGPRSRSAAENLRMIAAALNEAKVKAVGFVVGDRGGFEALKAWVEAGHDLGNHTWSHPGYSKTPIPTYLAEVKKTDRVMLEKVGVDLRKGFFRYPFLDHGNSEAKVAAMEHHLQSVGARLAHVSLDTVDYRFAVEYANPTKRDQVKTAFLEHLRECAGHFEKLSMRLFGRKIPLILLLHANELNADCMPAVLAGFKELGYRFVTLEEAVADEAYKPWWYRPPLVRCKGDRNFLNQIALSRGIIAEDISGDAYYREYWTNRLQSPANGN